MNHFTNKKGYDAIRSQPTWRFKAARPPGGRAVGAYFTTYEPDEPNLASKLRISLAKVGFYFAFRGQEGLTPIRGGRRIFVFHSPTDYLVEEARHITSGPTGIQ
jgi:hypothetical protein